MVFVLDRNKRPLMPCTPKRARLLLERKKAAVWRIRPFTIILKDRTLEESTLQPTMLKIAPGAKATGMALVRGDAGRAQEEQFLSPAVLALVELTHRGDQIRKKLEQRRNHRRRRRSANCRYREKRFDNRRRAESWLAPSVKHLVDSTVNVARKLRGLAPITAIAVNGHKFDAQRMENPEISGAEYQRGELMGYEVKEYLLEKHGRRCAYCGATGVPLEVDHIVPRASLGTDRVSNLTLACHKCNQRKGARDVREFLRGKPGLADRILAGAKRPLRAAAHVNSTRKALVEGLTSMGLPMNIGTGALSKYNRSRLGIPRTKANDAACACDVQEVKGLDGRPVLAIKSMGRGKYQRTKINASGFPIGYLMKEKTAFGFQTGDFAKAVVTKGKHIGEHIGRVVIRANGSFDIKTSHGLMTTSYKNCHRLQRSDGYEYSIQFTSYRDLTM
jgi:hypothetical protein